jgi:hypothetical protein
MNLSQHKGAFVIRFNNGPDTHTEWFEGRVEHVASGQLMHFYSRVGLMTFLERVLKEERADESRNTQAAESRSTQAPLGNSYPTLELSKAEKETTS